MTRLNRYWLFLASDQLRWRANLPLKDSGHYNSTLSLSIFTGGRTF